MIEQMKQAVIAQLTNKGKQTGVELKDAILGSDGRRTQAYNKKFEMLRDATKQLLDGGKIVQEGNKFSLAGSNQKGMRITIVLPETVIDEQTLRVILADALTDYINARTPVQDYVARRYPQLKGEHSENKINSTLTRVEFARRLIDAEKRIED